MTTASEWLENEGQPAVREGEEAPLDAHAAYERLRAMDLVGGGL